MEQALPNPAPADDIASFLPRPPEELELEPENIYEIAYQATARFIATERHYARKAALHDKNIHAQNNPKEWARQWADDPSSRAQIEEEHPAHLRLLRNQLAIANDIAVRERQTAAHTQVDERGKVQQTLGRHIWRHILYPGRSKLAPTDTSLENRLRGSAQTIVAPTGSGKTYIQGEALRDMGIGQPSAADPSQNRRALVCVSDQALVNQYLGKTGDNTFRSVLGEDVSIGAVWQYGKDSTRDVTVVVTSTLPELIKSGQIKPEEYDVTVVDEGHRALGKKAVQTLRELGGRLLLFTATPTYDERRKLERITDVASEGTIRDFVERGILSPVRLLTYRPTAGSETVAAAHLACKAIREGRKVLVYCKPSSADQEEKDTQYVSRLINAELSREGVASAAIGTTINSPTENSKLIDAFQERSISSLVTVNMLREGYNDPEVDTIILIGPRLSLVDIEQKIGRCMRKGDREALIIELIPERAHDDLRQYYSIWNVFGIESIAQGMLIEKQPSPVYFEGMGVDLSSALTPSPGSEQPSGPELHQPLAETASLPSSESPRETVPLPDATSQASDYEERRQTTVADYELPAALGDFYTEGPIRSITLSAEANAQEDIKARSTSIIALAERHNLPETWLRGRLDKANIPYTAIYEFDPLTSKRKYARWYDNAALEHYLEEHPLPTDLRIGTISLAQMLGVTKQCLTRAAEELNITPEPGVTEKDGRIVAVTYATADIIRIEAEIAKIPAADDETDVAVHGLTKEFEQRGWTKSFPMSYIENKKHRIETYDRRPLKKTGLATPADHISALDAERIRQAYRDREVATSAHISITEIAELAGVNITSVTKHLTDADRKDSQWLRREPSTRPTEHLTRSNGLAVVERLEQKKLPRHLVPGPMVLARASVSLNTLQSYLRRNKDQIPTTVLNLGINKATLVSCVTWEGLRRVEEFYGLQPDVQPVDYGRVERGDSKYIYETQRLHIDAQYLEPEFEWTAVEEARKLIGCTTIALPVLLKLVKRSADEADFTRKRDNTWEVKTEVLERMARYPAKPAAPERVSHSRLRTVLKQRSLPWPPGQRPRTTDAVLARRSDGIIDVFYEPTAVTAFIRRVTALKNRPTKE